MQVTPTREYFVHVEKYALPIKDCQIKPKHGYPWPLNFYRSTQYEVGFNGFFRGAAKTLSPSTTGEGHTFEVMPLVYPVICQEAGHLHIERASDQL